MNEIHYLKVKGMTNFKSKRYKMEYGVIAGRSTVEVVFIFIHAMELFRDIIFDLLICRI